MLFGVLEWPGLDEYVCGQDKPPNIMFTDRKYEPMGNVIMANVKASSL
jgi:hypothetical protein